MTFKNVGSMIAYPHTDKNDNALVMISTKGIDISHENQLYIHKPVKLPKYVVNWLKKNIADLIDNVDDQLGDLVEEYQNFDDKTQKWYLDNHDAATKLVEAILYGYEVEK